MRHTSKWISLILTLLILVTATGCGSTNQASASSTPAPAAQQEEPASPTAQTTSSTVVDNRKNKSSGTTASFSDEDFTKHEYLFENSIGDSLYFVVVTNNSDAIVSISGNATAKDASGTPIGAGNMSIDVLGPGETSIDYFYFDSVKNIASVDYQLSYSPAKYYQPVIGNLAVQQILNDKNVTVTVTNEGDINAQFVEAHALFFDAAGNVIAHSSNYVTDNDSEIKPGATISAQLDIYGKDYDHAEVYFTGRSDGKSTPVTESKVSDADFVIIEKPFKNSIGDTLWYLIVKNNSEKDAETLAALLKSNLPGMAIHVNLIPVNPIKERDFRRGEKIMTEKFVETLEKRGVNATVRRRLGADIDASCGQLRQRKYDDGAGT